MFEQVEYLFINVRTLFFIITSGSSCDSCCLHCVMHSIVTRSYLRKLPMHSYLWVLQCYSYTRYKNMALSISWCAANGDTPIIGPSCCTSKDFFHFSAATILAHFFFRKFYHVSISESDNLVVDVICSYCKVICNEMCVMSIVWKFESVFFSDGCCLLMMVLSVLVCMSVFFLIVGVPWWWY